VAVVGGGIAGLSAAHRVRTLLGPSVTVTVLEAGDRVGGMLRTVQLAGTAYDVGAEAFLARRPEMMDLLDELGLGDQLVHPGPARPAVLAGGHVRDLPGGTVLGVPSSARSLRALVSPDALAWVATEPQRPWSWQAGADLTVRELVSERLGPEVLARSVEPLLGGVYAGSADSLGVRATLPTLAAALDAGAPGLLAAAAAALGPPTPNVPVFGAVRGGYEVLLRALVTDIAVALRASVTSVVRAGRRWAVTVHGRAQEYDAVVLAVPAPTLATLLTQVDLRAAAAVAGVALASVAVVGLAYRAAAELPATSGLLVATGEGLHAKAFTHSSRKWAHLGGAPQLLRASVGRFGGPDVGDVDDDELVARVRADLASVHGLRATPLDAVVARWPAALPQYGPAHGQRVAQLEQAVARHPGLAVAGCVLHGVGVGACIATGWSAARSVVDYLNTPDAAGEAVAR